MDSFWFWFLISVGAGVIGFPLTCLLITFEDKRDGIVTSKKQKVLCSGVCSLLPVFACVITWLGVWFNL